MKTARNRCALILIVAGATAFNVGFCNIAVAAGDIDDGSRVYRACAACHSLVPNENLTGPSLAHLWGRKAGTLNTFDRYSPALKKSGLVWDAQTLDRWIADPQKTMPGTYMAFPGIKDERHRGDLIAFLRAESEGTIPRNSPTVQILVRPRLPDLKLLGPDQQVKSMTHCGDTYRVTKADGGTAPYWEFNLRFKTDSSPRGPNKGHPVLLPANMRSDRTFVIFADPSEISSFIISKC